MTNGLPLQNALYHVLVQAETYVKNFGYAPGAQTGVGKLGRSKVGLGKLGFGKVFGKVGLWGGKLGRSATSKSA